MIPFVIFLRVSDIAYLAIQPILVWTHTGDGMGLNCTVIHWKKKNVARSRGEKRKKQEDYRGHDGWIEVFVIRL